MEYVEIKKDIKIVLVGGRSCGKNAIRNALLGKAATRNHRQSLSMHLQNKKRTNSNSYSGQDNTKQCLRTESARRCGRQITVEHTEDTVNDDYFHVTRNKLKAEVKARRKNKKRKVVTFFTVYRKFTKDDDDMLDKFLCDLDFESRTTLFIALTDCVEDAESSQITRRQTLPIIHVKSSLTDKENENQIKEIIKQIQKENKLEKKKSGVIRIRWIRSTRLFLLLALLVLDVLEAKATDVRRDAEIVKWNRMTNPVHFGEYVDIECIIKSGNTSNTMAWKKSPHGEIIAFNTISVDVDKYDTRILHNNSQMAYILRIKNFNTSDVNLLYSCVYGFNSVGKFISLSEKDCIATPSNKDVKFKFSLTDSELTGNIQIRNGYPAPTCTGNFQGRNISEIDISNSNDSILFDSKIEIKHRTTMCKGTIMVTCKYGNRDIIITDEKTICSSKTEDQSHLNRLVYGITMTFSAGVLLLISVTLFTIKNKKKNERTKKMCDNNYQCAEYHKNEENGCGSWTLHDSVEDKMAAENLVLPKPKYTKDLTTIKDRGGIQSPMSWATVSVTPEQEKLKTKLVPEELAASEHVDDVILKPKWETNSFSSTKMSKEGSILHHSNFTRTKTSMEKIPTEKNLFALIDYLPLKM